MSKAQFNIRTELFEGPFELLLYLVSKKKVDIGAISIAEIADQYLEEVSRMQSLDLDIASDFLLVAATLLELKAQALIPKPQDEDAQEIAEMEPSVARDILIERLLTYKQYKNAAESLGARFENVSHMHSRPFGPDSEYLGLMPDFLRGVSIEDMGRIAAAALARREVFLLESEHIAAKPIPVEVQVRSIHARLQDQKRVRFSELIPKGARKDLAVAAFLAILELYKRQMVRLTQSIAFADIDIEYIEGSSQFLDDDDDAITYGGE